MRILMMKSPSGCAAVQHDALSAGRATAGVYGRRQQAGLQCCELPCFLGFAGIWRRNGLTTYRPEIRECLSDALGGLHAACRAVEALLHFGGV